jgi:hypothetical protein
MSDHAFQERSIKRAAKECAGGVIGRDHAAIASDQRRLVQAFKQHPVGNG